MIRIPEENAEMSISVFLKNGEKFERKDISTDPVGQHEVVVSFWEGNNIVVYPLDQVKKFVYHFGSTESAR